MPCKWNRKMPASTIGSQQPWQSLVHCIRLGIWKTALITYNLLQFIAMIIWLYCGWIWKNYILLTAIANDHLFFTSQFNMYTDMHTHALADSLHVFAYTHSYKCVFISLLILLYIPCYRSKKYNDLPQQASVCCDRSLDFFFFCSNQLNFLFKIRKIIFMPCECKSSEISLLLTSFLRLYKSNNNEFIGFPLNLPGAATKQLADGPRGP